MSRFTLPNPRKSAPPRPTVAGWSARLQSLSVLSTLIFRILLFVAVIALVILVYRKSRNDDYVLQSFSVPPSFQERGYDGRVIALNVMDRLGLKLYSPNKLILPNAILEGFHFIVYVGAKPLTK